MLELIVNQFPRREVKPQMRKLKYLIATSAGLATTALMASPAFASGGLSIPANAVAAFSITSVGEFVGAVLSLIFLVAGIAVFAYLVMGGIQWITSGGDKGKTQEARDRITAALVGLAVIAVAWAITLLAQTFFGINITSIVLPQAYQ